MNIIVTGASRGIGYELVKQLSRRGSYKILAIARNNKSLKELAAECKGVNKRSEVFPFAFDLLDGDYIDLNDQIRKHLNQKVDVVINNAGALVKKPLTKLSGHDFDTMFGVNMKAPFLLAQQAVPFMGEGSHFVNIGSMAGYPGSTKFQGMTLYSASKGALGAFTEALSAELQPEKIKVNCLAIGAVETEMMQKAFPDADAPLKPYEMAEYIAGFALNAGRFYNGKVLPVAVTTP